MSTQGRSPIPFQYLSKSEQEMALDVGEVRKGKISETAFAVKYGDQPFVAEERLINEANRRIDEEVRSRLPEIDAKDLDLPTITQKAWDAVLRANNPPFLFRFAGLPSRIEMDDDGNLTIRALTQDRLRHVLARVVNYFAVRYVKKIPQKYPALPPIHVVKDMLAQADPPLPVLTRVVEAPIFACDATLIAEPGYHPGSRSYYHASDGLSIPPVPERPSETDMARARELILEDLLGDFPFVNDAEKSNATGLLILPFARELIRGATPLHLIEKPTPGTGAGLLADVIMLPAMGRPIPAMTAGRDEDEWRKRITAKLLTGPTVFMIDNLRRRLEASSLSAAITGLTWEDRVLGHTEMVHVPVRCAWLATGNNPTLSEEIARRTTRIRLDAKMDRPWLRNG